MKKLKCAEKQIDFTLKDTQNRIQVILGRVEQAGNSAILQGQRLKRLWDVSRIATAQV